MRVKFKGVDDVIKNLKKAGAKGQKAGKDGLEKFAQFILSEAQEIVPFSEGNLQKSIIDEPVMNGKKVIGFDTVYAAKQHEDTSLFHPGPENKNPGRGSKGQAKYLETPLKQNSNRMKEFIGDEIKKVL